MANRSGDNTPWRARASQKSGDGCRLWRSVLVVWIALIVLDLNLSPAQAEERFTDVRALASMENELREELREIKEIAKELEARNKAESFIAQFLQIFAALVAIVGVPSAIAFIFYIAHMISTSRREQKQEEERSKQERLTSEKLNKTLDISMRTMESMHEQNQKIYNMTFEPAKETLNTINSLLTVTVNATRRASGAERTNLTKQIEDLNNGCLALISSAQTKDDRGIISIPEHKETVRVLSRQIESLNQQIQQYNNMHAEMGTGSADRIELTGPCYFVLGIYNHLESNFTKAIDYWKKAINTKDSESITVDANYWIGYEYNNIAEFSQAMNWLQAAEKEASNKAYYNRELELTRLIYETRFFEIGDENIPLDLIKEAENIYEHLSYVRDAKRRAAFATTIGNMYFAHGVRSSYASTDAAKQWFAKAIDLDPESKWAHFGYCQCDDVLGNEINRDILSKIVIPTVRREYANRDELRTKTLAKTTEYICAIWLKNYDELEGIKLQIEDKSSGERNLTIYSQFRKQNISKDKFREEMHILFKTNDTHEVYRSMRRG